MTEQFANQATSTLSASISTGATTLAVKSAARFPSEGNFRIVIGAEIMVATAVASKTFTVARGQEGTTATSHASGDSVACVVTAGALATKADQSQITILNLGTNWSTGERLFAYSSHNSAGKKKPEINDGTILRRQMKPTSRPLSSLASSKLPNRCSRVTGRGSLRGRSSSHHRSRWLRGSGDRHGRQRDHASNIRSRPLSLLRDRRLLASASPRGKARGLVAACS